MAEKDAKIQTFAPRIDWLEQAAADLYTKTGSGGTLDERLWRATLTGAETSGSWSPDPWTQTDLIYGPDSVNGMSLHQTLYGNNAANALKTQDGKGLYGWLFPTTETRWQYGPENGSRNLATEIFGAPDSGWVHALRAANLNLMSAIFKDVSYVGNYTIIDRINDLATELETLATGAEQAIGDVQTEVAHQADLNDAAHANLQSQIDNLRARINAGGL
ncbi:hypothetical protein [Hoeflea olei]|uniref:Uncharacterized protein n=1 Tax=Hoeflea olei TaxID=1480615 RepID=A0A1C1YRV7_9HYPH|nr:hypothetical protein [Hoeflea olei]OCW56258.1 hypothetical protein AWJ14_19380 [Hoeflea olei]